MLYQVLRRIAPKIRRRRMQLRDEDHKLAGPDKAATLVIQHFADVFAAQQATAGFTLREAFFFTAEEFTQCLHKLPAHKRLSRHTVLPHLCGNGAARRSGQQPHSA